MAKPKSPVPISRKEAGSGVTVPPPPPLTPVISVGAPYPQFGATRLVIPAPGTFNPDTNPPRIASHHTFDIGIGQDNIFHGDRYKVNVQFTVFNAANSEDLYNFLSTFSGTHFMAPRSFDGEIHFVF